jgi:hypothetical protein
LYTIQRIQILLKITFYYCATNFKPGYLNSNLGFCRPKAHSAKPILREKSFSWMVILTMFISHVTLTFSCSCNFFTKTVLYITTLDRRNKNNGSPQRSIIDSEQYAKSEINLPCSLVKDLDVCAALQLACKWWPIQLES